MADPRELFIIISLTRADIAAELNQHLRVPIGPDDPRLTSSLCQKYADMWRDYYLGNDEDESDDEPAKQVDFVEYHFGFKNMTPEAQEIFRANDFDDDDEDDEDD